MWSKTIQDVADQLSYLIKDYDVCLMVAKYYVKERVHQETEEAREFHMSNLDFHGHYYRTDHKLFCGQLRYLSSPFSVRHLWRIEAAAWQIPDLNKKKITLKDKLNDLKYIPKNILTGAVMKHWFHAKMNGNEDNYITV